MLLHSGSSTDMDLESVDGKCLSKWYYSVCVFVLWVFESTEDLPIILTHCNGFDKGNALHVCSPCQVLLNTKPIPGDAQSFLGLLHGRKLLHYT